ncbi:carboxypeptidase-like regulatory domain-containing protein [Halomonadaceae bacterium KBTZ08]
MSGTPIPLKTISTHIATGLFLGIVAISGAQARPGGEPPGKPVKISWEDEELTLEAPTNITFTETISFTPDQRLNNVTVEAVPALERFVTVKPTTVSDLPAGDSQEVTLSISVPANKEPSQRIAGTIHVREGNRTLATPFKLNLDVVPGPDPDEDEASSPGELEVRSVSENAFNPTDAEIVFALQGASFAADPGLFHVFHKDKRVPDSKVQVSDQRVTVTPILEEGRNEILFRGEDTSQGLIGRRVTLWAGERTLRGKTVDEQGNPIPNSKVVVELGDDPSVQATVTSDSSGHFRVENLPARTVFLEASAADDDLLGTGAVNGAEGFTTIELSDIEKPSDVENNDFSQGLNGWDIGSSPVQLIPHVEPTDASTVTASSTTTGSVESAHTASREVLAAEFRRQRNDSVTTAATTSNNSDLDLELATQGEGPQQVSRTFEADPGTKSVTVRHRFITTEIPGGFFGTQFNDFFSVDIRTKQGGDSVTESKSMNGLGLGAFDASGATAWREASLPIQQAGDTVQVELTVANVADGLFDSRLVVDLIQENEFAITDMTLNDFDDTGLNFLSTDSHSFFGGNTRVHGTVTVEGPSDDGVADLKLEVIQGGTVVATADLASGAARSLQQSFGEDGRIEIGTSQLLFELASTQASNVDVSQNGTLTLRARATSVNGETTTRDLGSVVLLANFDGGNRYPSRDPGVGGDSWAQPNLLGIVNNLPGTFWNDFSNMNGGPFPPHSTHRGGQDADGWFRSYNARDAGTAQRLIELLNTSSGSDITSVLVTYQRSPNGPFWQAIKDVTLDDGREAKNVILRASGHATHFHISD